MKRGITTLVILLLLVTPLILAQEHTTASLTTPSPETTTQSTVTPEITQEKSTTPKANNPLSNINIKEFREQNPWNGTIIISPTWQKLVGTFFGLNLKNESTEITVRETIVFIMTFIMFLVIALDILKMTSIFKGKLPLEFLVALIITTIVSVTGAFISLKTLFISGIAYTVTALDWTWLNSAIANRGFWTFFFAVIIIIIIIAIHEALSWIKPIIKKLSKISRAEAKGRMLKRKMEEAGKSEESIEEPEI